MGLNKSTGNMYEFITHTWNTIKGECSHGCTYCYMKRWGKQKPPRFDEKELAEFDMDMKKYGEGQFIFVGSSCDMFADEIPGKWIVDTLNYCAKYDNRYLFQSKNPEAFIGWGSVMPDKIALCTTIETNRHYEYIMVDAPTPTNRALGFMQIPDCVDKYITIEPIMDFDLFELLGMIASCEPTQVNIGADSMGKKLPEPKTWKIIELIAELEKFTVVHQKSNLKRLL